VPQSQTNVPSEIGQALRALTAGDRGAVQTIEATPAHVR